VIDVPFSLAQQVRYLRCDFASVECAVLLTMARMSARGCTLPRTDRRDIVHDDTDLSSAFLLALSSQLGEHEPHLVGLRLLPREMTEPAAAARRRLPSFARDRRFPFAAFLRQIVRLIFVPGAPL